MCRSQEHMDVRSPCDWKQKPGRRTLAKVVLSAAGETRDFRMGNSWPPVAVKVLARAAGCGRVDPPKVAQAQRCRRSEVVCIALSGRCDLRASHLQELRRGYQFSFTRH
jgi:hypothetical protein